uniref:NADH-ubiquinone oxidoreductase chain 5 n=1 Tax=Idotea baltica TaxID=82763 RepID=Q19TX6_9CRUS|nr:NADH dehydrogenase subunit 5 [Idotea baltica]
MMFSASLSFMVTGASTVWESLFLGSGHTIFNSHLLLIEWNILWFGSFLLVSSFNFTGSWWVFLHGARLYCGGDFFLFDRVFSMFFLVFSLNFVSILLGWDGLGIVSYILVIYYQNEKSSAAGMITALSNRIGDAAILLGIGVMADLGSWNFMFYQTQSEIVEMQFLLMMVILASMTKSAQMPFSAWLPAAMAAPTPVSALVHSSTLVTAGVYLLIRFNPLLMQYEIHKILLFSSSVDSLMASVSANFETDLKKIVALSTLSQLGIMVFTLSLGFASLAFFHLLTHAMFKALLFMCSGKVIHESGETQDSRAMGGLAVSLPYTSMCMNLSNLALCGFPFMAGFYSKDLLVESSSMIDLGVLSLIFAGLSVGLSASYSIRLTYSSMLNYSSQSPLNSSKEEDEVMYKSKLVLLFISLVSGAMLSWLIFSSPSLILLPSLVKLLAIYSLLLQGVLGGLVLSLNSMGELFIRNGYFLSGAIQMWFLPWLSGQSVGRLGMQGSNKIKVLDSGWWEYLGGQGIYSNLVKGAWISLVSQLNSVKMFLLKFGWVTILWVILF